MAGGGPERYHNVNPYSDQAMGQMQSTLSTLGGQQAQNFQNYNQSLSAIPTNIQAMSVNQPQNFDLARLGQAEAALMGSASRFDPMAQFSQIGQVAPILQGLSGPSSGYEANLMQQAQRASDKGVQNAAQQFGNVGGLFSGAAAGAMSEAAVNPFLQAQGQIMGMTNQNYQGMLGQGLNQLAQGNQFGAGLGMQAGQGLLQGAGMDIGSQEAMRNMFLQSGMSNQQAALQAAGMNQQGALGRAGLAADIYGTGMGNLSQLTGIYGGIGAPEMIYQPTAWESIIGPLVGGAMDAAGKIGGAALGGAAFASDARFKDNVKNKGLDDTIDKIRVVTWDWKPNIRLDKASRKMRTGMIAQEVESVYPDAVVEDGCMKKINYGAFVPLLIKEVQDLKEELKSLKEK